MNRCHISILLILFAALTLSCSGTSPDPILPASSHSPLLSSGQDESSFGGDCLWGLWEIEVDPKTRDFTCIPLRGAEFAGNVVKFIDNSPTNLVINIQDVSSAYFTDIDNFGGEVVLDITVWDWSAVCENTMEEYSIRIYSTAWGGVFDIDMTPTDKGDHYHSFLASIPVEVLTSNDSLPILIEVYYPGLDYASPFGVPNNADGTLASYFMTMVNIKEAPPQIYGIGDGAFFHWADDCDNSMFITNILNLPLTGPFADNDKVVWHEGHSGGNVNPGEFGSLVSGLGYTYEYIPDTPFVPLDVTGLKMLVIYTPHPPSEPNFFTPEEVQMIKNMVNGGGIVVILIEYNGAYGDTVILDKLLDDLGVDFSCPMIDVDPYGQYAVNDFSADPITEGLTKMCGSAAGCFDVADDAVSIVRNYQGLTLVCKSPIGD